MPMTLPPDGMDFVRRTLAAHHRGCNLDPKDDKSVRFWHLAVSLITWATQENIGADSVWEDAKQFVTEHADSDDVMPFYWQAANAAHLLHNKAEAALRTLVRDARDQNNYLNGDGPGSLALCPTGDDYDDLWSRIKMAAEQAGIDYDNPGEPNNQPTRRTEMENVVQIKNEQSGGRPPRKIIQITTLPLDSGTDTGFSACLFALCDDGTIWRLTDPDMSNIEAIQHHPWQRFPDIPQSD